MIALGIVAVVLVTLILSAVRLFAGPTLYDRVLAANAVVSRSALACAALAAAFGQPAWIDVALALVLGAFVLNVAVLKFFRLRSFQPPLAREGA